MNVLSLFDGISTCHLALDKAGIKVDKYYSTEIDKYAIQVADKNYPQDKPYRLGDVTKWKEWDIDWSSIGLVTGGFPYGVIKELYRKLTPLECERLQTLPDNYTDGVSNSQRYKMIGNGWTVDVIVHIFKAMKRKRK